MGTDALKDLRAWQRQQASEQDKALRDARRAKKVIDDLDGKLSAALAVLVSSISRLEATGLTRAQCGELLDLGPDDQTRLAAARRVAARPADGSDASKAGSVR
jgi:hypothetical protein